MQKVKGDEEMKLYYARIDRFGYTMSVVGKTKEEAETALLKEYCKRFAQCNNGKKPDKMLFCDGMTYLDCAKEEICAEEIEIGKVFEG